MRSHNKTMQSRCQNELGISAELRYVGFQKLLVIMRNRCQEGKNTRVPRDREAFRERSPSRMRSLWQDTAKSMSMRCWKFCRVKVCWVSKVVGVNAKPMSRMEVHTHTNKWTPNGNTRPYLFYICLQ